MSQESITGPSYGGNAPEKCEEIAVMRDITTLIDSGKFAYEPEPKWAETYQSSLGLTHTETPTSGVEAFAYLHSPDFRNEVAMAAKDAAEEAAKGVSQGARKLLSELRGLAAGIKGELAYGASSTWQLCRTAYEAMQDPDVRREGAVRIRADVSELRNAIYALAEDYQISSREVVVGVALTGLLPLAAYGVVTNENQPVTELMMSSNGVPAYMYEVTNETTTLTIPGLNIAFQDSASVAETIQGLLADQSGVVPEVNIDGENITISDLISNTQLSAIAAVAVNPTDVGHASLREEVPDAPEVPAKSPEEMTDEEYMDWLVAQVSVTAEDYRNFQVDESYTGVFDDELSGRSIKPTAFVLHWTAGRYKNGVDQFISAIKGRDGNCCNVMYFIDDDEDPSVYRFTSYWEETSHARGANNYTQGVEIEADGLRGEGGYTVRQLEKAVLLAYRFMDAADIEIKRENFLAHSEITPGKIDPPAYLMDQLFPVLEKLATEIRNESPADPDQTPVAPPEISSEESYQNALNALMEYIAKDEGSWDSVNRGEAGDTLHEQGGEALAAYREIFGDRMLTDLTIAEVMELQKSGKVKAVGKFQLIPEVLEEAVRATKMDINRKYDEDAQMELARDYLLLGGKRKALTQYLKGESNDLHQAIEGLCHEWASLVCNDGLGNYNGLAGNDARGGQDKVKEQQELLIAVRNAYIEMTNPKAVEVSTTTTTSIPVSPESNRQTSIVEIDAQHTEIETEIVQGTYLNESFARGVLRHMFEAQEDFDKWFGELDRKQGENGLQVRVSLAEIPARNK